MSEPSFRAKCATLMAILDWCTRQTSCKTCVVNRQCREKEEPRYFAEQASLAISMLFDKNIQLIKIISELDPSRLKECEIDDRTEVDQ